MNPGGQDFTSMFITVALAMLFICALAVVIIKWIFPRLIRSPLGRKGGPIQVIARYALAPHQAIYVVKIGHKHLVIGAGDRTLTPLAELGDTELAAEWKD